MNPWDLRALARAFGAAVLGLVVVWIVTAASDEGQLTAGARAGRSLPLAPLCSAVGAALALGTARVRLESRAFEALGRSPAETSRAAALGAALPSIVVALAIAIVPAVDINGFYPRVAHADAFVLTESGFESASLGVRVDADEGTMTPLDTPPPAPDAGLPRGARFAAASATAVAGLALALVSARAALRRSLLDEKLRRRIRATAFAETLACAFGTLIVFQAAAVRLIPAPVAVVPPLLLLALALARLRWDFGGVDDRRLT